VVFPKPHPANLEIVPEITKRSLRSKQPPYSSKLLTALLNTPHEKKVKSRMVYQTSAMLTEVINFGKFISEPNNKRYTSHLHVTEHKTKLQDYTKCCSNDCTEIKIDTDTDAILLRTVR
jgi:hypothetical protein